MNKIGVIGAGSWGTALAVTLSNKGHSVRIWDIDKTHIRELRENKENVRYLPGVKFCDRLVPADTVEEALAGADTVLFSAPAQHFRSALESAASYINEDMIIVNVAKGIEQKTLMRMSEITKEMGQYKKYAVLFAIFEKTARPEKSGLFFCPEKAEKK